MSRFRFKSIFGRMLFLQCVSGLLIIISLSAIIFSFLYKSTYAHIKEEMVSVWNTYKVDSSFTDTRFLCQHVSSLGIETISVSGNVSTLSGSQFASKVELLESKASDTYSFTSSFYPHNSHVLTLYSKDEAGDGLLFVHADASAEAEIISSFLYKLIILFFASSFVYCLVCCVSVRSILRPFLQMNHSVQCYSKGDFSKRITVDGQDEAAQLAKSFNEMAEQLRDMENTRRSFVANVSHELRSPLTSIKGFLEAMKDGTIPVEEHETYLDIVLSETRRMTQMVNDLLDLARIESGIITVTYSTFDLNELIRRILITFEARLSDLDIELDIRFSSDSCYVRADSAQISQVLRNLIDNSIKYSGNGKYLMISTYSIKKEVFVVIKDNGVGIPPEDVPHVFDRFYKVEKAHTPSPQVGSGLGLSIVKKIIEAHNQSITVKSAIGRGTQFTFSLEKANPLRISNRSNKA